MSEFPLLLEAPDRQWAEHVQTLIQRALSSRGSISLGLPGERLPDSPAPPGHVVTGIAICDEPEDEMLRMILAALADCETELREAPGGTTQIVVRPAE